MDSKLSLVFCLALSGLVVVGCKNEEEPPPVVEDTSGDEETYEEPAPEPEPAEVCSMSTVYFEFDSSDLDSASRTAIEQAVECYRRQGGSAVRLHLTGAADPRGTEEYNIALGERRAQSVRRYLSSLGLDSANVSVSSVGEEMARGTDEAGWAQDRNVGASEN